MEPSHVSYMVNFGFFVCVRMESTRGDDFEISGRSSNLNPWVNLVTRYSNVSDEPYLHLRTHDYVAIIALHET